MLDKQKIIVKQNTKVFYPLQSYKKQEFISNDMPLHELNTSAVLKNKQNNRQVDPQSISNNSPIKESLIKNSPQKKSSVNAQINQLKIKLSDRQFELKKLQQDCSVKLALMQKQVLKQKNERKLLQKQWKQKIDQDRHYYQTRLTIVDQEWRVKTQKIKNDLRKEIQQITDKQKKQIRQKYQHQIKQLKNSFSQKEQILQRQRSTIILQHETQKNSILSKHKIQIQQIYTKQQGQTTQMKQLHLSQIQFYHQLEDQKSKQQNVVSKILSDKIRGLEQELRHYKTQINQLNKVIELKNQQILNQKRQKQQFRLDKICLQRKLSRLQPQYKQQTQNQINNTKSQYQSKLCVQINQFNKKLSNLNKIHNQSKQNYQFQLTQLQERCKQVSSLFSTMKSNQDDLKKIQTLQIKLIRKDMELEKQREDTKMCKLQLSNMDQIFHKMFQQAKVKSLKSKKHRLPSLMSIGQNRSTMDCYGNTITQPAKDQKKFSIRQLNYHSIAKAKENNEFSIYS